MSPFGMDDLCIDFEGNLSMFAKPYAMTSKTLVIKNLSTRQVYQWNCLFILNSYQCTQNCRLRIAIPASQECEFEEDVIFYSNSFGVKLIDLLAPDVLQTYYFSVVKFSQYFTSLAYYTSKTCLTKISPETLIEIVQSRKNLEIAFCKGVILG